MPGKGRYRPLMPRTTKPPADPDDAPLKRLGGGRWQTRDERFTIEPQSGTWVVVDAEQTDDFGMPLVRGPYPSLTAAKEAISGARTSDPATSPLAARIEERRRAPSRGDATEAESQPRSSKTARDTPRTSTSEPEDDATETRRTNRAGRSATSTKAPMKPAARGERDEPSEPAWVSDLAAADRGRARKLIATLRSGGVADAEGLVRRDLVGDVPALAAHAIAGRLADLDDDATPARVAELLADGRDDALGVRWRLVDGDGRPILLESSRRRR